MALDATVGGASANSFVTRAEGDVFAGEMLASLATPWTGATGADKDASLIMATRRISQLCWNGVATTSTQALPVPRTGLTRNGGYAVPTNIIMTELKYATFLLALHYLDDSSAHKPTDAQQQGLTELKADVVTLKWNKDAQFKEVPDHVISELPNGWLCDDNRKTIEFAAL